MSFVLAFSAVGFFCGTALRLSGYGRRVSVSIVQEARYYSEHPEPPQSTSPIARGFCFACVSSLVPFGQGWCPGFLPHHLWLIAGLIFCAASTGVWLLVRGAFQRAVDTDRATRIERFVSDPTAPVPAAVPDANPQWLRLWNAANVFLFLVLMVEPLWSVFALLRNAEWQKLTF